MNLIERIEPATQTLPAQMIFEPLQLSRAVDKGRVQKLAESIREVGLLNPIIVTPKQRTVRGHLTDAYEILAGVHRYRAMFQVLNMREVPAQVWTGDRLHAELITIDQNLMRAELSAADRAKKLYANKVA